MEVFPWWSEDQKRLVKEIKIFAEDDSCTCTHLKCCNICQPS